MLARIVTVCKSGGEYRQEHVDRIGDQCRVHAPGAEFICLSDAELINGWPGWWSKIETFLIQGPVLYMDLDTTVIGDLSPLLNVAETHKFVALRDFNPSQRQMGSGLMAWSGDMRRIYAEFAANPAAHMKRCTTSQAWGDQGFIEPLTPDREYWQDLLPGSVVSWKKHCGSGVPEGARVICFHGKPRPWEI